ncbi:hypothetical protein Tco_0687857 [Tanacetum coccineum]
MTDAKRYVECHKKIQFGGNYESKKRAEVHLEATFEGFSVSNSDGFTNSMRRFPSPFSVQQEIHGAGVSTEDTHQKFLRISTFLLGSKFSLIRGTNHEWTFTEGAELEIEMKAELERKKNPKHSDILWTGLTGQLHSEDDDNYAFRLITAQDQTHEKRIAKTVKCQAVPDPPIQGNLSGPHGHMILK